MTSLTIIDDLTGDDFGDYWPTGETRRSAVHVLIVLAGDDEWGRQFTLAHPAGCDDVCPVAIHLDECEGEQSERYGYPPIPTAPGVYLTRLHCIRGGNPWGDYFVDHDSWLAFDDVLEGADS